MWADMRYPKYSYMRETRDRVPFYWKRAPLIQAYVGDGFFPWMVSFFTVCGFPALFFPALLVTDMPFSGRVACLVVSGLLSMIFIPSIWLSLKLMSFPFMDGEEMEYLAVNKYRRLPKEDRNRLRPVAKNLMKMNVRKNTEMGREFKSVVTTLYNLSITSRTDESSKILGEELKRIDDAKAEIQRRKNAENERLRKEAEQRRIIEENGWDLDFTNE